jgi:hypothetical protein
VLFPGSVDVPDEEHLASAGGFGARGSVDKKKEDGVEVGVSDVFPGDTHKWCHPNFGRAANQQQKKRARYEYFSN